MVFVGSYLIEFGPVNKGCYLESSKKNVKKWSSKFSTGGGEGLAGTRDLVNFLAGKRDFKENLVG